MQRAVRQEPALSRRGFIAATLASAGRLFYVRPGSQPAAADTAVLLNGWIRDCAGRRHHPFLSSTDWQGALTSLALIVAEDLAPTCLDRLEMAPVTESVSWITAISGLWSGRCFTRPGEVFRAAT